jgi:hypothetical protein
LLFLSALAQKCKIADGEKVQERAACSTPPGGHLLSNFHWQSFWRWRQHEKLDSRIAKIIRRTNRLDSWEGEREREKKEKERERSSSSALQAHNSRHSESKPQATPKHEKEKKKKKKKKKKREK